MANDPKLLSEALQRGAGSNPKPLSKKQRMAAEARSAMMQESRERMTHLGAPELPSQMQPQRLGYKSNARNPERMSPANAQKYSGIGPKGKPA